VEQDHRAVKRVTRPMLGFKAFEAAQATLAGIELMHMFRKQQLMVEAGDKGLTAAEQFYALAASSPHGRGPPPLYSPLSKICEEPSAVCRTFGVKRSTLYDALARHAPEPRH
jgi:hypothetical protein